MPNRVIKESIKSSPQIDSLTWFEEVVFYRLIVSADDYGCFDGRTVYVKNALFPTKESVTRKAVEDAIQRLASVGLLCKYTVNGRPYLFLPTWAEHQRIRNKHRKYPEPEIDLTANCRQVTADCQSESNPIQSESESNPNPSAGGRFDVFWEAYPRKVGKDAARTAFAKRKPSQALLDEMLAAISAQKNSEQWTRDGGRFVPNPSTWLNQGRWQDEVQTKRHGYDEHTFSDEQLDSILTDLDGEVHP